LPVPVDVDAGITVAGCRARIEVRNGGRGLPLLTERTVASGRVLVLNVRTFSEQDFRASGEWLLAPKPLGLCDLPEGLANELRRAVLGASGIAFEAPVGVGLYAFEGGGCLYNFRDESAAVRLNGVRLEVPAKCWVLR